MDIIRSLKHTSILRHTPCIITMLIKETMKKGAKEQKRHNYDYWNNDDNNDYGKRTILDYICL